MKRLSKIALAVFSIITIGFTSGFTQNVGIGTNSPDASAKLDLSDANRGLLLPRVALSNVTNGTTPVASPATGLLVWNTNASITGGNGTGFYYWDGSQWQKLEPASTAGNEWLINGNAGTNDFVNFIGTLDAEDLPFRTNDNENMRININGNVGIGTQISTARLYVNLPPSDNTTNYGIYNNFDGTDNGTTYGMRNHNFGGGSALKYGIYNETNSDGTGGRYGFYNLTTLNTSSISSSHGFYNRLDAYGSATNSASHYGIRNYVYTNGNGSSSGNIYGIWQEIDDDHPGEHYGSWTNMESSSGYNSVNYAGFNLFDGNGDGDQYGTYNDFNGTGSGIKYGLYNTFRNAEGPKFGVYNLIENQSQPGVIYGTRNEIADATNSETKYGVDNVLLNNTGLNYGSYNYVSQPAASNSSLYGVYGFVSSTGAGTHYGGYFYGYGDANYGIYASNSHTTGWAGYLNGNFYADGNTIINESGTADHDVRMEGDTQDHTFWLDADRNAVIFGSSLPTFQVGNVVDFDNGAASGTQIGIGSVEFLTDALSETTINNDFSPAADIVYDLGSATVAWDDVYADDFWNVSDARMKTEIKDLNYGLTEVLKLRPVTYKWKQAYKGETYIPLEERDTNLGFLAQDLQPVIKEVVADEEWEVESEENPQKFVKKPMDRLAVNYIELIPVLTKAIQEQQAQIEELKKELAEMKAKK